MSTCATVCPHLGRAGTEGRRTALPTNAGHLLSRAPDNLSLFPKRRNQVTESGLVPPQGQGGSLWFSRPLAKLWINRRPKGGSGAAKSVAGEQEEGGTFS